MDALSNFSVTGASALSQVLFGIVLVSLVYFTLAGTEFLYNSFTRMYKDRIELFPDTYVSGPRMLTVLQNPLTPGAKTILFSDNQRSGVEFTYAMFINISSQTINGSNHLYHILHKGYSQLYPLFGPGIFCWGHKNMLRIFMNSFDTWDNSIDIPNIPMDKWFHLTVSCKGNTIYAYINGNLKMKMPLSQNNSPAYQNYGNVYAFSARKKTLESSKIASLNNNPLFQRTGATPPLTQYHFAGPIQGMISRVYYFAYALTYTEIQNFVNMGPSTVMNSSDMSMTQYLSDTWWTNTNGP